MRGIGNFSLLSTVRLPQGDTEFRVGLVCDLNGFNMSNFWLWPCFLVQNFISFMMLFIRLAPSKSIIKFLFSWSLLHSAPLFPLHCENPNLYIPAFSNSSFCSLSDLIRRNRHVWFYRHSQIYFSDSFFQCCVDTPVYRVLLEYFYLLYFQASLFTFLLFLCIFLSLYTTFLMISIIVWISLFRNISFEETLMPCLHMR